MVKFDDNEGSVPSQLKNANIIPIVKDPKSNKHTFKNFRPISLTSIVVRISEKIIKRIIMTKLHQNNVIPSYQYGGRGKIGTIDALCHLWTDVLHNTAKFRETNVVFLDISKAFDRLIRELIIWKLKFVCGIDPPVVKWIHEFLNERMQRVKVWGSKSKWKYSKFGGPQGSVLLPILFSIYISDAPVDIKKNHNLTRAVKFVDDICCYSTGEYNNQIKDLNRRIKDIFEWSNKWGIDFNPSKCKVLTFSMNKNTLPKYDRHILLGADRLVNVTSYKYLGLTLNENMKFDQHIETILDKCNKTMYVINKISKSTMFGKNTYSIIYWKMKLLPMIEYGSEIWSTNLSNDQFEEISKFQIKFFRDTNKYGPTSCKKAILVDLAIEDISLRICSKKEKYVKKCHMGLTPKRIVNMYHQRNIIVYDSKIMNDPEIDCNYPNVNNHKGRTKFKSTATYYENNKKKIINFYSNNPRICEKDRKKWINKNINKWWVMRKPTETVFTSNILTKRYKSEILIDYEEIKLWKQIVDDNPYKTWNIVKNKIKTRTKELQMKIWNLSDEGKVLRKYKKDWWQDTIINDVCDPMIYVIKRMRIGNSKLNNHKKHGGSIICDKCTRNVPETNQHYLLECSKFRKERKILIDSISNVIKNMNYEVNVNTLLCFYPKIFKSKKKVNEYKPSIKKIYKSICEYIRMTKRF